MIEHLLLGGPQHGKTMLFEHKLNVVRVVVIRPQIVFYGDPEPISNDPPKGEYVLCGNEFYIWRGWLDNLVKPLDFHIRLMDEIPEEEVFFSLEEMASFANQKLIKETLKVERDDKTNSTHYSMWGCIPHVG